MAGRHAATGRHRRTGRVRETSEYAAFTLRVLAGYGDRVAADPAALVHLADILAYAQQEANRGIYLANAGEQSYSQNEIARILGVSRQAVAKRIEQGRAVHEGRLHRLAGARPVVALADVRASRAAGLRAARVADRTGSAKERTA